MGGNFTISQDKILYHGNFLGDDYDKSQYNRNSIYIDAPNLIRV